MKHPNAEVIHAIAEGKEVQWEGYVSREWQDYDSNEHISPIEDKTHRWRIKPEPKPDVVEYALIERDWIFWGEKTRANLKLTFDGKGNLKDAEVLKND